MSSSERILLELSGLFVLGIGGQWLASLVRLPSILVLLGIGILVGPVLHWIQPDEVLGDLVLPLVSLCVAVILFEGSLSLRLGDLRQIGRPLFMLLSVGVFVTWAIGSIAAMVVLQFDLPVALLIGAILTVTGPTVVGPLLCHIRPTGPIGPIARWEGIVVDPIGAVLAVFVFQAFGHVHESDYTAAVWVGASGFLKTIAFGGALGWGAAFLTQLLFRRRWVNEHLQSPFSLMLVVGVFALSNLVAHESGLVTVTVFGVVLANQQAISIRQIVEFKENLSVLLIATLFILLTSRLELTYFDQLGWRGPAFAALMIIVARPMSVWISTIGSGLKTSERLFLAWLAPRGIVAAAVASVFSLELGDGNELVAATFIVIIATVAIYGTTSGIVARGLGLSVPNPQGILIAGANRFARELAEQLQKQGVFVCLVDKNPEKIRKARMAGLRTFYADILSEAIHEEMDLGGIGRFLSLLPNDEVNSLAAEHCVDVFGRDNVYRLPAATVGVGRKAVAPRALSGRILFSISATYEFLDSQLRNGAKIKATTLSRAFTWDHFREQYGDNALVLFRIRRGNVHIVESGESAEPSDGQTIIAIVDGESAAIKNGR